MTHRTKYEFQSTLHRTVSEMSNAIAESWITADGANSPEFMASYLVDVSDVELAAECIKGWELDQDADDMDAPQSHMSFNGYDAADLVAAFRDFRSAA